MKGFLAKAWRFSTAKTEANKYASAFKQILEDLEIQLPKAKVSEYKKELFNENEQTQQILISDKKKDKKKKRARLSGEIKLKVVKDENTFDSPTGPLEIAHAQNKINQTNQKAAQTFLEGEKKIDKRSIDFKYVYKVSELFNTLTIQKENQKMTFDIDTMNRDSHKMVFKMNRYHQEYQDKEQEGDVEAFWDYIRAYPGSRLGPLPQDDPEFFYKYVKGRVPASVKESYRQRTGQSFLEEQDELYAAEYKLQEQDESALSRARRTPLTFRSVLSQNRYNPEQQFLGLKQTVAGTTQTFNVSDQHLPAVPEFQIRDYQSNWQTWLLWQRFRYFYNAMHIDQIFTRSAELFAQCNLNEVKVKPLASLFNYYKTLPKFLQDNEGLKTVYLGLQYKSPEWTVAQKEQELNRVAYLCLPLEESCDIMLTEHFSMNKFRMTAYETQRLFNIKPQYTYDIQDFYNEIKDEKIRGEKTGENKLLDGLNQEVQMVPQSTGPSLPVDFYDNNDGFWNTYIKEKMNRHVPITTGRKYFKH